MGKEARTGKTRVKRPGMETIKQRRARHKFVADSSTAQEIRIVKKQGPRNERGVPEGLPPQRKAWEKRLRALLKANEAIKVLQQKAADGVELDEQQVKKLQKADETLLEIDAIVSQHPKEAGAIANEKLRAPPNKR